MGALQSISCSYHWDRKTPRSPSPATHQDYFYPDHPPPQIHTHSPGRRARGRSGIRTGALRPRCQPLLLWPGASPSWSSATETGKPWASRRDQCCRLFALAEPQGNDPFHSNGLFNLASSSVFNQKSLYMKFPI